MAIVNTLWNCSYLSTCYDERVPLRLHAELRLCVDAGSLVSFGRVYTAYGGAFVVFSFLWGWKIDRVMPDRYDWLGAIIILLGAGVIMFAPRN